MYLNTYCSVCQSQIVKKEKIFREFKAEIHFGQMSCTMVLLILKLNIQHLTCDYDSSCST